MGWVETSWHEKSGEELRWDELTLEERRRAVKSWEELSWEEPWLRRADMRRAVKSWDELTWEEPWRAEKSWVETSCVEWRSWDKLKREGLRWAEKISERLGWHWHEEIWEQLWSAEKSWEKERRYEMRWDWMTQTAVTMGCKEQFPREAATRETKDEIRKDPTFKRGGTGIKSQEVVAPKHRRPASNL